MTFGSTAKVLLKCKLKYYRISECRYTVYGKLYYTRVCLGSLVGEAACTQCGEGLPCFPEKVESHPANPEPLLYGWLVLLTGQEELGSPLCFPFRISGLVFL